MVFTYDILTSRPIRNLFLLRAAHVGIDSCHSADSSQSDHRIRKRHCFAKALQRFVNTLYHVYHLRGLTSTTRLSVLPDSSDRQLAGNLIGRELLDGNRESIFVYIQGRVNLSIDRPDRIIR